MFILMIIFILGVDIRFDANGTFSFSLVGFDENVIIFGVDNSYFMHADNKKKDMLVFGKVPTNGLDDTTITAEAEYAISFSEQQKTLA